MRIVHVSIKDNLGADRAGLSIHFGLLQHGMESLFLVRDKTLAHDSIIQIGRKKIHRLLFQYYALKERTQINKYKNRNNVLFSPSSASVNLSAEINSFNPDIVHFHWINKGFLKLAEIVKIKCPIVLTCHDMWYYTGGCHYDSNCEKFMYNCGNCPQLNSGYENDLSRKLYNQKKRIYNKINNLSVTAPSSWMFENLMKSSLFKDNPNIHHIPCGVNTKLFKPIDKTTAKSILNIKAHKKLIVFGALDANSDPRKGYNYLIKALNHIKKDDVELCIIGGKIENNTGIQDINTIGLGKLNDNLSLSIVYSAADISIVPSIQENLSNVVLESLSCGTPVAGFNIGGNKDMIDHRLNGYLAKPKDAQDLARGIDWILEDSGKHKMLCTEARRKAENKFDNKVISKKYIRLYSDVMNKH